jgi:hypothetical protein
MKGSREEGWSISLSMAVLAAGPAMPPRQPGDYFKEYKPGHGPARINEYFEY